MDSSVDLQAKSGTIPPSYSQGTGDLGLICVGSEGENFLSGFIAGNQVDKGEGETAPGVASARNHCRLHIAWYGRVALRS